MISNKTIINIYIFLWLVIVELFFDFLGIFWNIIFYFFLYVLLDVIISGGIEKILDC